MEIFRVDHHMAVKFLVKQHDSEDKSQIRKDVLDCTMEARRSHNRLVVLPQYIVYCFIQIFSILTRD